MRKYMFDTNVFDKVLESGKAIAIGRPNDLCIFATAMQIEEIAKIPDKKIDGEDGTERRVELILTLFQLGVKLIPTAAILGYARIGTCVFGNNEIDQALNAVNDHMRPKGRGKDNIHDSMIAEAAIREKCILVTEDKDLYDAMKAIDHPVMKWDEFRDMINKTNTN